MVREKDYGNREMVFWCLGCLDEQHNFLTPARPDSELYNDDNPYGHPCHSEKPTKGGLGHMAYLAKFHETHREAKDLIRKYLETDRYLSMLEGHPELGYVHAHNLYFLYNEPSQKAIDTIQNHWNNTLGMGSAKHGIKIEIN